MRVPAGRGYLEVMLTRVFGPSANQMSGKLEEAAASGKPINMEAVFNQLTLDVIGKAVFNYDFQSLTTDSPIIQVPPAAHLLTCRDSPAGRERPEPTGSEPLPWLGNA